MLETYSLSAWPNLTSDPEILSTVTGTIIEFDTPPITKACPNIPFSIGESDIIDQEIAKMLAKGIVEVVTHAHFRVGCVQYFYKTGKKMATTG
jgi:hypothetical protein